jgi:hypothetical protein
MKRVIRFFVWLYPAPWRRRYGAEFDALLGDISPGLRDLFDVLRGALEMQMTIGTFAKSAAVFGVACALLAGGASLTLSDMYRSLVLIHVQTVDGQPATLSAYRSELTDVVGRALSQESLLAIMEKEYLYPSERANKLMDVAIDKMRQDVRIIAKRADAIEVSFDYPDAVRAQRTTLDLVTKIVDDQVHRAPENDKATQAIPKTPTIPRFEILDEPSLPKTPVRPNRTVIMSFGLGVGILIGAVVPRFRRPRAERAA